MVVKIPSQHSYSPNEKASGPDRSRIDLALSTAHSSREAPRRGIPGLRRELFPAAAWRRQVDDFAGDHRKRTQQRQSREEARLTHLLADLRAEDILQAARGQARRLVGAAAAVAKARREQADRAATAKISEADRVAADTLSNAQRRAQQVIADSDLNAAALHARVLQLHAALRDAETRLGKVAVTPPARISDDVVDLVAIEAEEAATVRIVAAEQARPITSPGDAEMAVPDEAESAAVTSAAQAAESRPKVSAAHSVVPKSRFQARGPTPDRIEALRDEQST